MAQTKAVQRLLLCRNLRQLTVCLKPSPRPTSILQHSQVPMRCCANATAPADAVKGAKMLTSSLSELSDLSSSYSMDLTKVTAIQKKVAACGSEDISQALLQLNSHQLIKCINSLLAYKSDSKLLRLMEKRAMDIMWTSLTYTQLCYLYSIHNSCVTRTDLRNAMEEQALKCLTSRFSEMKWEKHMCKLFEIIDCRKGDLYQLLELEAMKNMSNLSPTQAHAIFCSLGQQGRRTLPLLGALSQVMLPALKELSPNQLGSLVIFSSKLTFFKPPFLQGICQELTKAPDALKPQLCSHLVNSLSHLRWKHEEFTDLAIERIVANPLQVHHQGLVSLLEACGRLAHSSETLAKHLENILKHLNEWEAYPPKHRVGVDASLAVLGCLPEDEIQLIFSKDFATMLKRADISPIDKLRLQSIHAYATAKGISLPDVHPAFNSWQFSSSAADSSVPWKRKFQMEIQKVFAYTFPLKKYAHTLVHSDVGYVIGMELVIDENGTPQPISHLDSGLKEGWKRIAIQPLMGQDLVQPQFEPLGFHQLAKKQLTQKGYTVVEILKKDFIQCKTQVSKVQYLEQKLKSAASTS